MKNTTTYNYKVLARKYKLITKIVLDIQSNSNFKKSLCITYMNCIWLQNLSMTLKILFVQNINKMYFKNTSKSHNDIKVNNA